MNALEKFASLFAPQWAVKRAQARLALRHYDAASTGRRSAGWRKKYSDADTANDLAISELRAHARDLVRNNSWARRGVSIIANNTVGWGLRPKPVGGQSAQALKLWRAWADSTQCETEGRHTFSALQALVILTVAVSGECLVRRRLRQPKDGLAIPLQLQVIEPDYLDVSKTVDSSLAGGPIIQGVEFDKIGRRAAYWLFDLHPGSAVGMSGVSRRVSASEIIHVYQVERPEQTRGVSWLGSAIAQLKDLDDLEDAELMKQKIAACFAAFVTDTEGLGSPVGDNSEDSGVEMLEPGMVSHLPPGKTITFGNPPTATSDVAAMRALRKIAAGLGITYEDLTGDYSHVNFSSARMARIAHWGNVHKWQHHMMIPLLCQGVWKWAMEAAQLAGLMPEGALPTSEWITPAMPMLEPDKEGLAYSRLVRNGVMTYSQMIREQGGDPDVHWIEYAADQAQLDAHKIKLDSDVRAVSAAGLTQERGGMGAPEGEPEGEDVDLSDEPEEKPAEEPKRYSVALTLRESTK